MPGFSLPAARAPVWCSAFPGYTYTVAHFVTEHAERSEERFSRNAETDLLRSDKFSGVVTLLLAGMLAWQTPWLSALDRRIFDQGMLLADETPSARVSVIAVDAESESRLGPWPWSRDIDAHLIDQLAAAGARLIAYTPCRTLAAGPCRSQS